MCARKGLSQSSSSRLLQTATPASVSSFMAIRPRNEKTPTAGCRSFVPANRMPRRRHAARSTSCERSSHASYMSGIAAPGFMRATVGPSSGRRWPLLVTMSASSSGAASLLVSSSIRSPTPAAAARFSVDAIASSSVPKRLSPATAWTSRAPASAARTGVTP